MRPLGPVDVIDLFAPERAALLTLLESLDDAGWRAPTVCDGWCVQDLAAHVAGDDLNVVSWKGDGRWRTASQAPRLAWDDLLTLINTQNEQWVAAMRRFRAPIVLAMLRWSGDVAERHYRSIDLDALGGPVDWAGPDPAPNWFDVAREYTERWHHHQQIRDAVGAPPLTERRLFAPVLDAFARALPHTYRDVAAPEGTHVRMVIEGDAGGSWSLVMRSGAWALLDGVERAPDATIAIGQDDAWRLFTAGLAPEDVRPRAGITGDVALASVALTMRSIIA